nr:MAG TPA: hypothetical protein [Caudoviricetes sp.]
MRQRESKSPKSNSLRQKECLLWGGYGGYPPVGY